MEHFQAEFKDTAKSLFLYSRDSGINKYNLLMNVIHHICGLKTEIT